MGQVVENEVDRPRSAFGRHPLDECRNRVGPWGVKETLGRGGLLHLQVFFMDTRCNARRLPARRMSTPADEKKEWRCCYNFQMS